VLQEEKLSAVHARLGTTTRKSLKQLAQVTSVSNTFAQRTTKLLRLWLWKKTVVLALKEH